MSILKIGVIFVEVLIPALLFLVGILLIVKGGDLFVDASTWMAEASGIPKFLIGATVVSLATTLPEIIVSLMAAFQGATEMAIGNAVGSVTANTGLIMGISLVFLPIAVKRRQFAFKACLMAVSPLVLWLLARDGALSVPESLLVLVLFVAFIWENIRSASQDVSAREKVKVERKDLTKNLLFFAVGAAGLVVGSRLLVDNGTILATMLGVSERVIAVTMVAIGTSLPELVTAITAIVKKQTSLSVGNILGANIIDITIILPLCAMISGGSLPVIGQTVALDLPICFLETIIAVVPTMIFKKFNRWQGVVMIAVYLAYLGLTVFG